MMKTVTLFSFLFISFLRVSAQSDVKVYYLPPADEIELMKTYNLTMLRLALEKTKESHGNYEIITQTQTDFAQRDALRYLKEKKELYVVPTMTDAVRERIFIPVRIPLYKGLFGLRMMMVSEDEKARLTKLSPNQLKQEVITQGLEWPDTQILKANGYSVAELTQKQDMIEALLTKKATLYPRSIVEIWDELTELKGKGVGVLESVCLYYPTAMYYFVQRSFEGKKLADRLEVGLQRAIDDGSFDDMFKKLLKDVLEQSKLNEKQLIKLTNPILSEQTPLQVKAFWYVDTNF